MTPKVFGMLFTEKEVSVLSFQSRAVSMSITVPGPAMDRYDRPINHVVEYLLIVIITGNARLYLHPVFGSLFVNTVLVFIF